MPNVIEIPFSDIDIDFSWNSRSQSNMQMYLASETDSESSGMEGLVLDILKNGQTTPVDLRTTGDGTRATFYRETKKPYSLVTGFRRCTAFNHIFTDAAIGLEAAKEKRTIVPHLQDFHVKAVVHGDMTERDAYFMNAHEGAHHEKLTPQDCVMMVKKGLEVHKVTPNDLSLRLGKTLVSVLRYSRIAKLPNEVLAHWHRGGEFEGLLTSRSLSLEEMDELSKEPAETHKDKYRALLSLPPKKLRLASKTEKTWVDWARDRAHRNGVLLAQLEKNGLIRVLETRPMFWRDSVRFLAGTGNHSLSPTDIRELSEAAIESYTRELKRPAVGSGGSDDIDTNEDTNEIETISSVVAPQSTNGVS